MSTSWLAHDADPQAKEFLSFLTSDRGAAHNEDRGLGALKTLVALRTREIAVPTNPMKTIFDDLIKRGTGFVNGEFFTKLVYKGVG